MDREKIAKKLLTVARGLMGASVEKTYGCGRAGYCTLTMEASFTFDKTLAEMKRYSVPVKAATVRIMRALERQQVNVRNYSDEPRLFTTASGNLPVFRSMVFIELPDDEEHAQAVKDMLEEYGFKER